MEDLESAFTLTHGRRFAANPDPALPSSGRKREVVTNLLREDISDHLDLFSSQQSLLVGRRERRSQSQFLSRSRPANSPYRISSPGQRRYLSGALSVSLTVMSLCTGELKRVHAESSPRKQRGCDNAAAVDNVSPGTRHRSVLAIAGRLEQLANKFEDDNALGGGGSGKALLGMLEKQQKEINELKVQRRYESSDGSRSILRPRTIRTMAPSPPVSSPSRSAAEEVRAREPKSSKYTARASRHLGRTGTAAATIATAKSQADTSAAGPLPARESKGGSSRPRSRLRCDLPGERSAAAPGRHAYKSASPFKADEGERAMRERLDRYRARLEACQAEVVDGCGIAVNPATGQVGGLTVTTFVAPHLVSSA